MPGDLAPRSRDSTCKGETLERGGIACLIGAVCRCAFKMITQAGRGACPGEIIVANGREQPQTIPAAEDEVPLQLFAVGQQRQQCQPQESRLGGPAPRRFCATIGFV